MNLFIAGLFLCLLNRDTIRALSQAISAMSSFKFKQFEIQQDACAMKVSLDACLLGALCHVDQAKQILDIGAGTGLLSLMLAQRCTMDAHIQAIELDTAAFKQAAENIKNSPFSNKIHIEQGDIKLYKSPHLFDVIICNPPFFSQQLKGQDTQRNLARHNDGLSFSDLTQRMKALLQPKGKAWVLLPTSELERFQQAADTHHLSIQDQWLVFSRSHKPAKICIFTLVHTDHYDDALMQSHRLTVYDDNNVYTDTFSQLLADYYLKL